MTLVDDLTVVDNMLLPHGPTGLSGMIRRRHARDPRRPTTSSEWACPISTLDDEIGELDLAIQQKIENRPAPIFRKPRILLLDEPTSTLSGRDGRLVGRYHRLIA